MDGAVSNSDVRVDELCKPPKCLFFFPTEAHSELSCLHFFFFALSNLMAVKSINLLLISR